MEAEKTKKARKPRKQPKVHVEVVGSWQDRPAYEAFSALETSYRKYVSYAWVR